MKTVSIITTYYNAEQYILQTIHSINQQKYDANELHIEYILVNDCSLDNTENIIKEYISLNTIYVDFKLYTTDCNLGCGGARKFGIEKSTGEYLMFIDADDYYLHNDFISRAVNDIETSNADIVEYGVRYHELNGNIINNHVDEDITLTHLPNIALVFLFKENVIKINVWSKIIRRTLIDQYPYSELREFEDVDTIPNWVYLASKILIKPTVEINYRQTRKSITSNMNNTRLLTLQTLLQYFEKFKNYRDVILALYERAMIDLEIILNKKTSNDVLFNEMSLLNTYMLRYVFPNNYQERTYNIEMNNQ